MTGTAPVLIARALHVVGSVVWAGFVMLIGFWFLGSNVADGPERSRWLRQAMVNRGADRRSCGRRQSFVGTLSLQTPCTAERGQELSSCSRPVSPWRLRVTSNRVAPGRSDAPRHLDQKD